MRYLSFPKPRGEKNLRQNALCVATTHSDRDISVFIILEIFGGVKSFQAPCVLHYSRADDDFQSRETSGAFFQTYKGSLMDPNYKEADKLMILSYF